MLTDRYHFSFTHLMTYVRKKLENLQINAPINQLIIFPTIFPLVFLPVFFHKIKIFLVISCIQMRIVPDTKFMYAYNMYKV